MRLYTDEIEMMARRAGDYMDEVLLSACDLALAPSTAPEVRDSLLEWDDEFERRAFRARCCESQDELIRIAA